MDQEAKQTLTDIKALFKSAKEDAEMAWKKYKFLQIQLDMLDDRMTRVEDLVGQEIEVETFFDLEPYEDDEN